MFPDEKVKKKKRERDKNLFSRNLKLLRKHDSSNHNIFRVAANVDFHRFGGGRIFTMPKDNVMITKKDLFKREVVVDKNSVEGVE